MLVVLYLLSSFFLLDLAYLKELSPRNVFIYDVNLLGAKKCSQCEGTGINLVDHFNGQFKAGAKCWICRLISNYFVLLWIDEPFAINLILLCSGRKEVLCGDCNGAGFIGGFLSRFDEVYD